MWVAKPANSSGKGLEQSGFRRPVIDLREVNSIGFFFVVCSRWSVQVVCSVQVFNYEAVYYVRFLPKKSEFAHDL